MDGLIQKIRGLIPLSTEAEIYLRSIGEFKKFSKGETLIRAGQWVNATYYVTQGSIRSFCIDREGKEHTLQFAIQDWWISDYMAVYDHAPASLTVECLTDSEVIAFDPEKLDNIYLQFPEFEPYKRKNLERHIVSLHKRILNQLQLSATERYVLFLEQYPELERSIPNYHIASYLGMTQQSLSRVRAQMIKR